MVKGINGTPSQPRPLRLRAQVILSHHISEEFVGFTEVGRGRRLHILQHNSRSRGRMSLRFLDLTLRYTRAMSVSSGQRKRLQ